MDEREPAAGACLAVVAIVVTAGMLASCKPPPQTNLGVFIPRQVKASESIAQANYLGVDYMRMEQQVTQPVNGTIRAFRAAGKKVNMVVKAGPGTTSQPPASLDTYKANLATRLNEYRTPLLAIENEETANNFYAGTAQ